MKKMKSMKQKCFICIKEIESNDVILTLSINLNRIEEGERIDLICSPIKEEDICSWCAEHLEMITNRGYKTLEDKE